MGTMRGWGPLTPNFKDRDDKIMLHRKFGKY